MQSRADEIPPFKAPQALGGYEILGGLARGGMATVCLARRAGEAGFQRLFAVKVMHPHLADDAGFVNMLLDEARIAALLHHPNVVPIVDLGSQGSFHYVVMEYVEGCSFSALLTHYRNERPPRLIVPIVLDMLAGLYAAHTLQDDDGQPLRLVHRDVSPQNVMVGLDGAARITDFGVARAEARIHSTRPGQLKGKIAFMAPEQIVDSAQIDQRADLFSAGVLLWTALTGRRLFLGSSDAATLNNILHMEIPPPSSVGLKPPTAFDAVCLKALARDLDERFNSAHEMEEALREAALTSGTFGSRSEVGAWVKAAFGNELEERRKAIRASASTRRPNVTESHPTVSGLRMVPRVGAEPDTPSGSDPFSPAHASPSQAPTVSASYDVPNTRKRALALVGLAGVALAALVAGALILKPAPSPSTTATAAVTSSALTPAPAEPAPTPAASADSPAPSVAATESAAPTEKPEAKTKPVTQPARSWKRPSPAPVSKPAPAKSAAPTEPAKKPKSWDRDSPMLPP
jgi:eukaryotic-like serine/threonine-protein kinase